MAIRFRCPSCGQELSVKEELAGKQGRCPKCKNPMTIPSAGGAAPPPLPPPAAVQPQRARKPASDFDFDDEPAPVRERGTRRDEIAPPAAKLARRISLALLFHSLSSWLFVGAFGLSIVATLIFAGSYSSKMSKIKKAMKGEGPKLSESEIKSLQEEQKSRQEKEEKLFKWLGEKKERRGPPSDSERKAEGGIDFYANFYTVFQTILGFLVGFFILGALILFVIGSSFMVASTSRGMELGFAIAVLATSGISLACMIFVVIKCFTGDGGFCAQMAFCMFNPFAGLSNAAFLVTLATWIVSGIGFVLYLVPILEIGRMAVMYMYQMALGYSYNLPGTKKAGLIHGIVLPSVVLFMGLVVLLIGLGLYSINAKEPPKEAPSAWPPAIILLFYGLVMAGVFVWSALATSRVRAAIRRRR